MKQSPTSCFTPAHRDVAAVVVGWFRNPIHHTAERAAYCAACAQRLGRLGYFIPEGPL